MSFVLYDRKLNVYAGLNGLKTVFVPSVDDAIKFDCKKDNPNIKIKFYNAITGANFEAIK